MIAHYGPIKPRDLQRWFSYVGMTEDEFDRIADTFRDPRVWRREGGRWLKDDPVSVPVERAPRAAERGKA